jgi:uncharacterized protein with beta-barrel porin domain
LAGATATATAEWRHALGNVAPTTRFAFDGGGDFVIAGGYRSHATAPSWMADLDFKISPKARLSLSYDGMLGGGVTDNGRKIRLSVAF